MTLYFQLFERIGLQASSGFVTLEKRGAPEKSFYSCSTVYNKQNFTEGISKYKAYINQVSSVKLHILTETQTTESMLHSLKFLNFFYIRSESKISEEQVSRLDYFSFICFTLAARPATVWLRCIHVAVTPLWCHLLQTQQLL